MLLLQGTMETKDNNQRILTPTGLLLFYVADAKSPDVFKLPRVNSDDLVPDDPQLASGKHQPCGSGLKCPHSQAKARIS